MYVLNQIWPLLLGIFLLGVLVGYFVWRFCGRPYWEEKVRLAQETLAARTRDVDRRLAELEAERNALMASRGIAR
jgi:hypothetical protein